MDIQNIIQAIQSQHYRITDHADEEAQADRLKFEEILYSVCHGEVIADYPTDRPFPSCLIYGPNEKGEPIHTVWAFNEENR